MNPKPTHPLNTRRQFLELAAGLSAAVPLAYGAQHPATQRGLTHVCPKSAAPASKLYAMRVQDLTTDAEALRLTLYTLQGLVNRRQPVLYLIQDRWDEQWLDWLRERGDVKEVQMLEIGEVFERFLRFATCMFITDPEIPASVNVATMLAGVNDGIVATPSTAQLYNLPSGAPPDDAKVGKNLRDLHWKRDVDAYRWAYAQVGDRLSRQAIAFLDPSTSPLRDYLVEFRIPILWISAPEDAARNPQAAYEEELALSREILMKWPPNIPCMGWPGNGEGSEAGIGEWAGVLLASQCGKFEICSGFDGYSPTVSNLSVHSGTTAKLRQSEPAKISLQKERVYYAFIRSDGDGLNFLRHYYRKLFDDPQHGAVPMGWQVGPGASDCMPDILDYFYKHAHPNDCFVNALTGVGYIWEDSYADNYPEQQRQEILDQFRNLSSEYRERIDASVLTTFAEMSPARLNFLAGMDGIKGIFANYGRTHVTTSENLITIAAGKPVIRALNGVRVGELTFTPKSRRDAVISVAEEIRNRAPSNRPAFLYVFLANWMTHMEMVANIAKELGPEYVPVRPDQLVALYNASA